MRRLVMRVGGLLRPTGLPSFRMMAKRKKAIQYASWNALTRAYP